MTSYFYVLQRPRQTSPADCLLGFPLSQNLSFCSLRGGPRLHFSHRRSRQLSSSGQDDVGMVRS
jgi:hypothetical protein